MLGLKIGLPYFRQNTIMGHIFGRHCLTQSKLLFPGWGGVGWAGPGRVIVPSIRYNSNYNIHLNSERPMGMNISPPHLRITYLQDGNKTIQICVI